MMTSFSTGLGQKFMTNLTNGHREHIEAAVIDVLANEVNSSRCTNEILKAAIEQALELGTNSTQPV
jgi:hypothetical protein